jgi:hypothetical protein
MMSFLEKAWEQREESIYKALFGDLGDGIYPLPGELFTERFEQPSYDPRWLSHGVFQSPPNKERETWLYVSSGMSNPWQSDEAEEFSGLGSEFVLETNEASEWALEVLHNLLGYNILLAHGKLGDGPLLHYGDRIPMTVGCEDDVEPTITSMVLVEPDHYPASFDLISGKVELLHVIGATGPELDFAKKNGSEELLKLLIQSKVYPVTELTRDSISLSS